MPYSLGPVHDLLSGSGSVSVSAPAGLLLELSQIPSGVSVEWGTPTKYYGLGRITPADSHGWFPDVPIHYAQQLVYPLPAAPTLVGYDLVYGMGLKITELVEAAVPNSALDPWDRAPADFTQSVYAERSGTIGDTTLWTYTVPAGRKLWLAQARLWTVRLGAATTLGQTVLQMQRNTARILFVVHGNNTVTDMRSDALDGGPIVLVAGEVLRALYSTTHTAGVISVNAVANGFLFNA